MDLLNSPNFKVHVAIAQLSNVQPVWNYTMW